MTWFLLGVMLIGMHSTPISAITFDRYHSQSEINAYLQSKSHQYPELVETKTLGYSRQGRAIHYAIIQPKDGKHRDALLLNGTHHGNEKSSTEAAIAVMDYLLVNQDNSAVREILKTFSIYILPLVNPDGHAADTRTDSQGIDINRDYSFPLRKAEDSFRTESTQLIRKLMEQVRFQAAIAYHSGMEAILWPACYTDSPPTDLALFRSLSKKTAMGFGRYLQSFQDYPSEGEFIDFAYSTYGTLAITMEVSEEPMPSEQVLLKVVERSVKGSLAYIEGLRDYRLGRLDLEDENPSPFSSTRNQFPLDTIREPTKAVHH
jgi:predicted deacylase